MRSVQRGSAPVTTALVAINVAVFIISIVMDREVAATGFRGRFTFDWGLYPPLVGDGEWWRLVTGGFLHANLVHIGFNMFLLWLLGSELEPFLGRLRFGLLYATSLLAGSFGVMLLAPHQPTVGASGAVFGLMGAMVVAQRALGIDPWQSGIGSLVAINLVFTFLVPNISIGGHLGGLLLGEGEGFPTGAGSGEMRHLVSLETAAVKGFSQAASGRFLVVEAGGDGSACDHAPVFQKHDVHVLRAHVDPTDDHGIPPVGKVGTAAARPIMLGRELPRSIRRDSRTARAPGPCRSPLRCPWAPSP